MLRFLNAKLIIVYKSNTYSHIAVAEKLTSRRNNLIIFKMKKGLFVLASILILGLTSCSKECTCTTTTTGMGETEEVKLVMKDVSAKDCKAANAEASIGDVTVKTVCK